MCGLVCSVVRVMFLAIKAGEGNRTLVFSLEGYCSTIELHPRSKPWAAVRPRRGRTTADRTTADRTSGECRIRTCEGIIHQIYSLTPLTARETPLVTSRTGRQPTSTIWCRLCSCSCLPEATRRSTGFVGGRGNVSEGLCDLGPGWLSRWCTGWSNRLG